MSAVSKKSNRRRFALRPLPVGTGTPECWKKTQRKPPKENTCLQTPGTCESCPEWEKSGKPEWMKIHGPDCDCIACHDFKKDTHRPEYLGDGIYQCPDCCRLYHSYPAANKHMGRVANILGDCPGNKFERGVK
jgi:hypothetical protein